LKSRATQGLAEEECWEKEKVRRSSIFRKGENPAEEKNREKNWRRERKGNGGPRRLTCAGDKNRLLREPQIVKRYKCNKGRVASKKEGAKEFKDIERESKEVQPIPESLKQPVYHPGKIQKGEREEEEQTNREKPGPTNFDPILK